MKTNLPSHLKAFGINQPPANADKFDKETIRQVRDLISYLVSKRETLNKDHTSYGLKHIVERILDRYVSNGEFIAAMILEGYRWKPVTNDADQPNAFFYASYERLIERDPSTQIRKEQLIISKRLRK